MLLFQNVESFNVKSDESKTDVGLVEIAKVALNATKYVIMTDVTARLNLEESYQYSFRSILQVMQ